MVTFSSSFVFDISLETGITISQSRRHIRTDAKTYTKKQPNKINLTLYTHTIYTELLSN